MLLSWLGPYRHHSQFYRNNTNSDRICRSEESTAATPCLTFKRRHLTTDRTPGEVSDLFCCEITTLVQNPSAKSTIKKSSVVVHPTPPFACFWHSNCMAKAPCQVCVFPQSSAWKTEHFRWRINAWKIQYVSLWVNVKHQFSKRHLKHHTVLTSLWEAFSSNQHLVGSTATQPSVNKLRIHLKKNPQNVKYAKFKAFL